MAQAPPSLQSVLYKPGKNNSSLSRALEKPSQIAAWKKSSVSMCARGCCCSVPTACLGWVAQQWGAPVQERFPGKDTVKAINQLLPTHHTPSQDPSQSGDGIPHLSCLRAEVPPCSLAEAERSSWVPRTHLPVADSPEQGTLSWHGAETQSEDAK